MAKSSKPVTLELHQSKKADTQYIQLDSTTCVEINLKTKKVKLVTPKEAGVVDVSSVVPTLEDIKANYSFVNQKVIRGIVHTLYRAQDNPKHCVLVAGDKIKDFDVKSWGKL